MVGNIEYNKFLNDEDWLPKKLEKLYVASMNTPFNQPSQVISTQSYEDDFPLMPRDVASLILNNRDNAAVRTTPAEEKTTTTDTDTTVSQDPKTKTTTDTPVATTDAPTATPISTSTSTAAPVAALSDYKPTYITNGKSGINLDRARYWFNELDKYGMTPFQKIALITAMNTECALNPVGAVNKYELTKGLNTKGGWAHAGEAAFGLTHWNTKKKYIDLYNADPRRRGPKLSNIESEYANPNARHIANLDDEDHGLLTSLFYKDLINKTKDETDLRNIVAEFYLRKAGSGYFKTGTPHERAVNTGKHYQKVHAGQGFTKASKTNQYLKSLDRAVLLARELGVIV